MAIQFHDRVAIVTGGGGGLGRQHAPAARERDTVPKQAADQSSSEAAKALGNVDVA